MLGKIAVRTFESPPFITGNGYGLRISLENEINVFLDTLDPRHVLDLTFQLQTVDKYSEQSIYLATVTYRINT